MPIKTILLSITKTVAVEVPDDVPIDCESLQRIARWKLDETCDGRRPFSTEMIEEGTTRAVSWAIEETIFQHVCDLPQYHHGKRLKERNKMIAKMAADTRCRPVYGIEIKTRAAEFNEQICISCGVLCSHGPGDDGLDRCSNCGSH